MDAKTIINIHQFLTKTYLETDYPIKPEGIRDKNAIEAASSRKDMSFGGVDLYPSVFDKAAVLFHSILNNHAFFNGNKRTALLSLLVFLGQHHLMLLNCTDEELFSFVCDAAAHRLGVSKDDEVAIIKKWLKEACEENQNSEDEDRLIQKVFSDRRFVMDELAKT